MPIGTEWFECRKTTNFERDIFLVYYIFLTVLFKKKNTGRSPDFFPLKIRGLVSAPGAKMEAINSLAGSAGIIVFGPSNGGEVSHPKSGEDTSSKITSTFSHSSLQKDSWRPASGTIQTESQNTEQKLWTRWCKEQACAVKTGAEDSLDNPATSNGSPARHWCREHACDVVDCAQLAHSSHSHHLSSDSWWKVNTLEVVEMARALPACGNALPVLCGAMRSLLTSQAMLLDRHTREEIVQWADDIYQKGELSVSIKLENSKTTLGLVLFDDVVEIVLPGGPAFRAGLQKGDSILTVRTF